MMASRAFEVESGELIKKGVTVCIRPDDRLYVSGLGDIVIGTAMRDIMQGEQITVNVDRMTDDIMPFWWGE